MDRNSILRRRDARKGFSRPRIPCFFDDILIMRRPKGMPYCNSTVQKKETRGRYGVSRRSTLVLSLAVQGGDGQTLSSHPYLLLVRRRERRPGEPRSAACASDPFAGLAVRTVICVRDASMQTNAVPPWSNCHCNRPVGGVISGQGPGFCWPLVTDRH